MAAATGKRVRNEEENHKHQKLMYQASWVRISNFRMEDSKGGGGRQQMNPDPLSAERRFFVYIRILQDVRVYQQEANQRPLDAGEEVRVFETTFHRIAERHPVPRGKPAVK